MAGRIVYKDVAPFAAGEASFSAQDKENFSNLALNDATTAERSITLGVNRWVLDGSFVNHGTVHYWSHEMSGEDCSFANPPVIDITFAQQHSSLGVSLVFDTATGEYCQSVTITWYQNGTVKAQETFSPDAVSYFCGRKLEAWDRITITLNETSLPYRRAKVEQIIFGVMREFETDEIMSANAVMETDLISAKLPAGQLNWTINSKETVDFMFQSKQPVELYNGQNLLGVYYVDFSERKTANIYDVTAYDAIGVLGEQDFAGGAYINGVSAKALLSAIVGDAFEIVYEGVEDATLYGLLVPQTKREAMQQVLFAWGAVQRTDDKIHIFSLPSVPSVITESETYAGVSLNRSAEVTKVNVIAHTYAENANGQIEIGDKKYSDTETMYTVESTDVTANGKANVREVNAATLVSTHNGQAVAQRLFDYYLRRNTHKSKIVLGGQKLGDCVEQPTAWNTTEIGNITAMNIILSNVVAAEIESVGVEE